MNLFYFCTNDLADDMAKLQVQLFGYCSYYPPESHHVYREPQSPLATRPTWLDQKHLSQVAPPNQRSRFIYVLHVYDVDDRNRFSISCDFTHFFYIPLSEKKSSAPHTRTYPFFFLPSLSVRNIHRRCGFTGKFTHFRPDIHGLVIFPVIVEGTDRQFSFFLILHF